MRLNVILDIYRLRVKVFFGAIRASKAGIAVILIYTFGLLPSVFSFSFMVINAVERGIGDVEPYVNLLAAAASVILAVALLLSLRGCTVFEYEQNIILTSPINPGEFLAANILNNLTFSLVFVGPLIIFYILIVSSLRLPPHLAAIILLASLIYAISLLCVKTFFSVLKALYRRVWLNALVILIVFLLLLPAVSFFVSSPIKYSVLPYPSSLLARILVDAVFHRSLHLPDVLGLTLFLILSLILFTLASRSNIFPLAIPIPLVSPLDVSIQMQELKMRSNISFFSRMGSFLTLNVESKSMLGFLMRKEVIRMIREGSLFAVIFMYAILSIVIVTASIASARGVASQAPGSAIAAVVGVASLYSLIIPLMLTSNWRLSDSKNLWIPISSGADMRLIIKATLYSFMIVSIAAPLAIVLPISAFYRVDVIQPLTIITSSSIIGCSANLYVTIKFLSRKRGGVPFLLVGWISILLSAILLAPVYILVSLGVFFGLNWALSAVLFVATLAYSAVVARILLNLSEKNISRVEI